jgi:hypothetical protein
MEPTPAIVHVELFGVPRRRAGIANVTLHFSHDRLRLRDVLAELGRRFPSLAESCLQADRLKPGYLVSLDGQRFIRDPESCVPGGTHLLLLAADAGG